MKKFQVLLILLFSFQFLFSQRMVEILDRGVEAMPKSSGQIYISWRHFATDPDEISYNIYFKTSPAGALTLINNTPITNSTNYTANLSTSGSACTFVVKSILNGIEKDESGGFTLPRNTLPKTCRIGSPMAFNCERRNRCLNGQGRNSIF